MPWHSAKSSSCPASRPWAVIKDTDGSTVACHSTKADADRQVAALYANEPGAHSMSTNLDERAKYNADQLAAMAKNGQAMPDGSYPIGDVEDLRNAIRAVGRGSGSHNAIRMHIMRRAKALGASNLIPDNWNADGSMMASAGEPEGMQVRAAPFTLERDAASDGLTLEGYAAVFNSPTLINSFGSSFEEVIAPGAFKRSINAGTPKLMFDHGQHPVLGQMPIGSIQDLREDPKGLHLRARLFDNWMTEPLRQAITDGAVDGMSFRFEVIKDTRDTGRNPELRTLNEVKLYELGPVVFPAYKATSVALRSLANAVPGLTLTFTDSETAVDTGTPDEPVSARTSDGPATPDDPTGTGHSSSPIHGMTVAERQQMARRIRFERSQ